MFLGYSSSQSAYKCFDPSQNRIFISRHIQFHEKKFSFASMDPHSTRVLPSSFDTWGSSYTATRSLLPSTISSLPSTQSQGSIPYATSSNDSHASQTHHKSLTSQTIHESPIFHASHAASTPTSQGISFSSPCNLTSPDPSNTSPSLSLPNTSSQTSTILPAPLLLLGRTHPMITRSQNNIFKPKHAFASNKHSLPPSVELTYVSQAIKNPQWQQAMSDEFNAVMKNGRWDLVPHNHQFNIVGCKWIFRVKRNLDGSI